MTHLIAILATPTPSPVEFDENQVTPGVIGFVITAALFVAIILLLLDMVRRVRRVRYRAEARERIEQELATNAADESGESAAPGGTDAERDPRS